MAESPQQMTDRFIEMMKEEMRSALDSAPGVWATHGDLCDEAMELVNQHLYTVAAVWLGVVRGEGRVYMKAGEGPERDFGQKFAIMHVATLSSLLALLSVLQPVNRMAFAQVLSDCKAATKKLAASEERDDVETNDEE